MYHNKYTTNILCAVHTQENSVETYKKAIIFFFFFFFGADLKRQETKYCRWCETNTVSVKEYKGLTGQKKSRLLLEWRWEAQGKKNKEGCKSLVEEVWGRAGERESAEVTLLVLYGFLDAEKHGGEPLVQPWNGVVFFHLRNEERRLEMTHKTQRKAEK